MSESSSDSELSSGWTVITAEELCGDVKGSDIEVSENGVSNRTGNSEASHGLEETGDEEKEMGKDQESKEVKAEEEGKQETVEKEEEFSPAVDVPPNVKEKELEETSDTAAVGAAKVDAAMGDGDEDESTALSSYGVREGPCGMEAGPDTKGEQLLDTIFQSHTVTFPAAPADTSSSEDDVGQRPPSPAVRKRKKGPKVQVFASVEKHGYDGEEKKAVEEPVLAVPAAEHVRGSLRTCISVALLVAVCVGLGLFYGMWQIEVHEKGTKSTCLGILGDVGEDLPCQSGGKIIAESKIKPRVEEGRGTENRQLKRSLEREEVSVSTLQEELRNLRAQIRNLEGVRRDWQSFPPENLQSSSHLKKEHQNLQSLLGLKDALKAEAQVLRRELDRERRVTSLLREELEQLSGLHNWPGEEVDPDTEVLKSRVAELEKKLTFEQERSDLWERLYLKNANQKAKGKHQVKPRMFGTLRKTHRSGKNHSKDIVYRHREEIKKAKEIVKENIRKLSVSVKSSIRHIKDSARHLMGRYRCHRDKRIFDRKAIKEERQHYCMKLEAPTMWHYLPFHRHSKRPSSILFGGCLTQRLAKGCSGVLDCAYQESMTLFNKVREPIREDEFKQVLQSFLQQQVGPFHHWGELESFINSFFRNKLFIHDQMLFTDFVSSIEGYLEDMDEYQLFNHNIFVGLDEYIYRHFFGDAYSKQFRARSE